MQKFDKLKQVKDMRDLKLSFVDIDYNKDMQEAVKMVEAKAALM